MFHLMNYFNTAGINDANVDMAASTDSIFSIRNGHFIFSEQYNLLAAMHLAANALRSRFNVPSWNTYGRQQIWPVGRSATPQSYPRIMDWRDNPVPIPVNEEVAIEESNNLGAATEATTVSIWIAPPGWNRNIPKGGYRVVLRATAAVARVANAWSGLGAITLADNPKGGWYLVNAVYCFDVNCRLFRLHFPSNPLVSGRVMRPGSYATNAVGNLEMPYFMCELGVWGRFHTFELPLLEVYADAAGASTQELRIDATFVSEAGPGGPPSLMG